MNSGRESHTYTHACIYILVGVIIHYWPCGFPECIQWTSYEACLQWLHCTWCFSRINLNAWMDHDHKSFWQTRKGSRAQHYGCWSRLGQIIGVIQQLRCKKIPGSIIAQFHCEPWTDRGFIRVASIPSSLAPLHPGQASQWPKFSASARAESGETSPARISVQNKLLAGPAVLGSAGLWDLAIPGLKWLDVSVNLPMAKWTCQFIDDFPNMVMFTC